MLDQAMSVWGVRPDIDLNLMQKNQALVDVTVSVLQAMLVAVTQLQPDIVVLQGDTTTTLATALACFYARVPVAHVEAGLRTWKKYAPFPEEINRRITTLLADIHFAPTEQARQNLLAEGVPAEAVHVTGNTVIDALLQVRERIASDEGVRAQLERRFDFLSETKRLILVTAHRRESFGEGFEQICRAIRDIAELRDDVQVVYPVHLNPSVREPVYRLLRGGDAGGRIHLLDPLPYLEFVYLLNRSCLVLTDSGGLQKEAYWLGVPCLTLREETEWVETVDAGWNTLVGSDSQRIVHAARTSTPPSVRPRMYGEGNAAGKCVELLG